MSLLDPLFLAKLPTMELRARRVVEGAAAGRHRSPRRGHSLEFAGHRPYAPSDEWRHIDWKVFARTDRWVVRERQEESNLRCTLLLDVSRSMAFGSQGRPAKLRCAAILAAALAYLLIHRRESVGLGFFGAGLSEFVPARGGAAHLARLLDLLENARAGGSTDLRRSLEEAGSRLPRRGMVVVLSDFLSAAESVLPAARALLARKHEVAALQILDPWERALPDGNFLFQDMETGESLRADAGEVREDYGRAMADRLESLRHAFDSAGAAYHLFDTSAPLDRELALFLQRRLASA
jgi:uncharacterized protein (DUF58 family)